MKNLSIAIYSKLAGSALNTAVGGRFYKGRAPEGTVYPYVVYMLISDVPANTFTEYLENVLIQFSLFSSASGSTEVEDIYSNLKTLYDECTMTITGNTLLWMKRESAILMVEDHTTASGTMDVWHYAVDYSIMMKKN